MANAETQQLDSIISSRRALLAVGGVALAGLAFAPKAEAATISDADILNFALNLEYLEAQFYSLAVNGQQIQNLPTPISINPNNAAVVGTVTVKPNSQVPFADAAIKAYAAETAIEEGKHVSFLQKALNTAAVAMPDINLLDSFNTLAKVAGVADTFDPFASDASFLIGAYIFEDTGVSAYHGAAPLITDKKTVFPAALGIHTVEAYHAGLVRLSIDRLDAGSGTLNGYTQKISAIRYSLANPSATSSDLQDDIGLTTITVPLNGSGSGYTATTITDANPATTSKVPGPGSYSIAKGRTTSQILAIVTGGPAPASGPSKGVFFPSGMNGTIQ